jgi:D-amino-acid oxidase
MMNRRNFLHGSGALAGMSAMGLSGCTQHVTTTAAPLVTSTPDFPFYDAVGPLIPIRADSDRVFRITVCTRPFRAKGPRQDVEQVGDKCVVHNYGHGGSGWSLSWGSGDVVVRKAVDVIGESGGPREIAVIGAGALGLTAALTAQRAGFKVTIYARERAPYVRSVRATGSWTPDSRVALTSAVAPDFAARWEAMARTSFAMYMTYIGSAGYPVEWTDRYALSDEPMTAQQEGVRDYARYMDRIADLTPHSHDLPPGTHPFPTKYARDFHTPQELSSLPQRIIINCTGYAARQLWSDESITPVRGQITWLIPQEGATYGLNYNGLNMLARRDGIVLMLNKRGEDAGWNDSTEVPDHAMADESVGVLQELYARMAKMQAAKRA